MAASAQDKPVFSASDLEFFESKIRPIFADHCYKCHGPEKTAPSGGLRFVSREVLVTGGDTGPAIEPGKPSESLMIEAINYTGLYEMPPDSQLPDSDIQLLTKWVEMGAPWPTHGNAIANNLKKFDLGQRRSSHWCWQPVHDPPVPDVKDATWIRQPLDAFVLALLEKNGLHPAARAEKSTLIRRLYFDLIGLPPSPADVETFVNDTDPQAYEHVVDRLLASPQFGECWARHWMDLVRYAETYGHEYDYPIPYAFEYRDYLIRAFNADVPYNDFVREHIAGDLLKQPRRNPEHGYNESVLATGFWYLGEAKHGPVDVVADEAGRIDNQLDVFGKTFLGLTVACARCHDHMFDAISTKDYYALAGFMQSSRRQLAMIDVDHRIDGATKKLDEFQQDADDALARYRADLVRGGTDDRAAYFAAALRLISERLESNLPELVRFQGEDFADDKPAGGAVQVQDLNPVGAFTWDKNRQLWWTDGKPGDQLRLEFAVPHAGKYQVNADFTKDGDYGIAKISLDDAVVREAADFFSKETGKTGEQTLFNGELQAGKHTLLFEITGHNEKATDRNMLGLDYFELKPDAEQRRQMLDASIAAAAQAKNLEPDVLANLYFALQDPALDPIDHPLHALRLLMQQPDPTSSSAKDAVNAEMGKLREAAEASRADSELLADFNSSPVDGWFTTGWAFDRQPLSGWHVDSSPTLTSTVAVPGTLSSGRRGEPLYGVLRSPTFLLDKKFIHYHIAGRDTEIKIVIDGYTLDNFNSLLFNGATVPIKSPDRFMWIDQGADVSNYVGHRAHLEIVDLTGGSACIDEIRLSDQPKLAEMPSEFGTQLLQQEWNDFDSLGASLSELLTREFERDAPTTDSAALVDWSIRAS